jgi:SAM-dependent methyltransferase
LKAPALIVPLHMEADEPDSLLMCLTRTPANYTLAQWAANEPGLHQFPPDYHRLQLERWLWDNRADLVGKDVLDVGVIIRREWVGAGYRTFGERDADIIGDIQAPVLDTERFDAVLCTEVLEHVPDPMQAMREIHRVLRPGGVALLSSPFVWPWHGGADYQDYWRITHQGWRLLTRDFAEVKVTQAHWTDEGLALIDLVRRFEGWGWDGETTMTTGYCVRAVK